MPNNTGWWDWIVNLATDLPTIYTALVDAGIIKAEESLEGMSREEIAAMVDARLAAALGWRTYLPWIIAGGLGIGLLYVALRKK